MLKKHWRCKISFINRLSIAIVVDDVFFQVLRYNKNLQEKNNFIFNRLPHQPPIEPWSIEDLYEWITSATTRRDFLRSNLHQLLMKSQTTTWDVKSLVNNGINYQPQLVTSGFFPINSIQTCRLQAGGWFLVNLSNSHKNEEVVTNKQIDHSACHLCSQKMGWVYIRYKKKKQSVSWVWDLKLFQAEGSPTVPSRSSMKRRGMLKWTHLSPFVFSHLYRDRFHKGSQVSGAFIRASDQGPPPPLCPSDQNLPCKGTLPLFITRYPFNLNKRMRPFCQEALVLQGPSESVFWAGS